MPAIIIAPFTHSVQTRSNDIKFAHQLLCSPKISTLLKATWRGFLGGCPNINKKLITKYLNPSPGTAKSHMKQPRHEIKSTHHKQSNALPSPTSPIAPYPPSAPIACIEILVVHEVLVYPGQALDNTAGTALIGEDDNKSIANVFCFGAFADRTSDIVYHNLTGSSPFMSYNGSVCFFILYHYKSNSILATAIAGLDNVSIFQAYK